MSYLIDSDRVADYLKGRPEAHTIFAVLRPDGLAFSVITCGEICEGIYFGRDPEQHEQAFLAFLRPIDVVPLTLDVMRRLARIRGALRARGQLIGDPDILIAATAIEHNLTLVTRNLRDFRRIPDLKLYDVAA